MNTSASSSPPAPALAGTAENVVVVRSRLGDYLELTKPRLSFLSVVTTVIAYLCARPGWFAGEFVFLVLGTAACAGGVAALNQWMESDTDARMERTAGRPIPSGRVPAGSAFVLGWGLCAAGLAMLFAKTNGLAAFFALLTMVTYLAVYTPAKRWSRWSTEIGAVSGALPPLIGWSAATGGVAGLGWVLFGILFFWQIPHFMAVAWTYRRDYGRVHFPMLPVRDPGGAGVAGWSLVNALLLIATALLPWWMAGAGVAYVVATAILGVWFVWRAVAFLHPARRDVMARRLFFASIIWLPLQLGLLVADRFV
ncbi:protoheme IX farnesyltransferase [Opitutaceae bacterium TAV4]|nr:protoheme IX farnesyltransferase [Opitutaceae bacterium TAV4]RRJ99683.1 protoheme IX farnesyltransferase [Opitutaceae bacterium TAV3]